MLIYVDDMAEPSATLHTQTGRLARGFHSTVSRAIRLQLKRPLLNNGRKPVLRVVRVGSLLFPPRSYRPQEDRRMVIPGQVERLLVLADELDPVGR